MSHFISHNREELIRRCTEKVATRPFREATGLQLQNGVPLFMMQLQRTLEAEEAQLVDESLRISGASGGETVTLSELGLTARAHGKQLLDLGYNVDQVVHDYGDLCQAITDLAVERDAPFAIREFRTLNRCLDNGIASAVTGFIQHRDASHAAQEKATASAEREDLLASLRNPVATATYAIAAMQLGNLPVSGSTGFILKRSIEAMRMLVGGPTFDEVIEGSAA